jgi:hypothetical protein
VADRPVGLGDHAVMVRDVAVVQLQHEGRPGEQPLVLGAAVIAAQAEQVLVPAAGGLDVAHREHRLGLRRPGRDDDPDAVARGVVHLHEPALAAVELRTPVHPPAVRADPRQRRVQLVGADPRERTVRCDRPLGGELPDHPRRGEPPVPGVDRPAEHPLVERGGPREVDGRDLQVADLAGCGVRSGHRGSS